MSINWHEGWGLCLLLSSGQGEELMLTEERRTLGEGHGSFLPAPSQSSTSGEVNCEGSWH